MSEELAKQFLKENNIQKTIEEQYKKAEKLAEDRQYQKKLEEIRAAQKAEKDHIAQQKAAEKSAARMRFIMYATLIGGMAYIGKLVYKKYFV
mmetsp:Transcript_9424/g.13943  ORF Transcript_9424/g.13943 Transcript_9424/m.13943 type:complete len:92 (+) Transcript_9424:45-320(+)